jgi:hypothetical protein
MLDSKMLMLPHMRSLSKTAALLVIVVMSLLTLATAGMDMATLQLFSQELKAKSKGVAAAHWSSHEERHDVIPPSPATVAVAAVDNDDMSKFWTTDTRTMHKDDNTDTATMMNDDATMDADDDSMNTTPFCKGMMSMTMSMGGFQWSLFGKEAADCLTYFVSSWTLDSRGKFQGAIIYSFLLAVLTEWFTSVLKHLVVALPRNSKWRRWILAMVYGAQHLLGYIIMMVAMSYSFELFFSLITGLMVGSLLFKNDNDTDRTVARNGGMAQDSERPSAASSSRFLATSGNIADESRPLLEDRAANSTVRRRR